MISPILSQLVAKAVSLIPPDPADPVCPKGVCLLWIMKHDSTDPFLFSTFVSGSPNDEEIGQLKTCATRKVQALFRYPNCDSSWQLRNPEYHVWGGAIRVALPNCHLLVGYSGLPKEVYDETVSLCFAVQCGYLLPEKAERIAALSSNTFFTELYQAMTTLV